MKFFSRLAKLYVYAAIVLLNTVLVFLVFNYLSGAYLKKRAADDLLTENKVMAKYRDIFNDPEIMNAIYPGMSQSGIKELLDESWNRDFVYLPWVMYGERPIDGEYVKVDPAGFRAVEGQGPWPPSEKFTNVFLFGGSTLFGYGLAQGQTVADYLQEALAKIPAQKPYKIYNFGMGTYFSTQERIFFQSLLTAGFVPDLAVFLDGFNDPQRVEDAPWNSERFRQMMESSARHTGAWEEIHRNWLKSKIVEYIPVMEGVFKLERLKPGMAMSEPDVKSAEAERLAGTQIERFARNKRIVDAVSKAFGVRDLYVWQPASKYNADTLAVNPFTSLDDAQLKYLYAAARRRYDQGEFGDNFSWCADILKGKNEPLYVDSAHYSYKLAKMCADCVLKGLEEAGMIPAGSAAGGAGAP